MNVFLRRGIAVLTMCAAPTVFALDAGDAADPVRAVPGVYWMPYRSAFADYKPLGDAKPGDWRALNDAVRGDGMANMPGRGTMPHDGMPGMGAMAGHAMQMQMPMQMPMPMPKAGSTSGTRRAHTPVATSATPPMKAMPDMPGMPGMPAHSGHGTQGGKP